jgi:hypothetical protein
MATDYKYLKIESAGETAEDLIKLNNNPNLPKVVIERVVVEFNNVNGEDIQPGQTILVPILAPFHKNHKELIDKSGSSPAEPPQVKEPPKPVVIESTPPVAAPEPKIEVSKPEVKKKEPKKKSLSKQERLAKRRAEPKKTAIVETSQKEPSKIKYKTYPFTITSPMNTIEAIVRNYNDMNMSRAILNKLVYEMNVRYTNVLSPNDIVFIDDSSIGESFYARITSVNINVSREDSALMIDQNITIERYLDE